MHTTCKPKPGWWAWFPVLGGCTLEAQDILQLWVQGCSTSKKNEASQEKGSEEGGSAEEETGEGLDWFPEASDQDVPQVCINAMTELNHQQGTCLYSLLKRLNITAEVHAMILANLSKTRLPGSSSQSPCNMYKIMWFRRLSLLWKGCNPFSQPWGSDSPEHVCSFCYRLATVGYGRTGKGCLWECSEYPRISPSTFNRLLCRGSRTVNQSTLKSMLVSVNDSTFMFLLMSFHSFEC